MGRIEPFFLFDRVLLGGVDFGDMSEKIPSKVEFDVKWGTGGMELEQQVSSNEVIPQSVPIVTDTNSEDTEKMTVDDREKIQKEINESLGFHYEDATYPVAMLGGVFELKTKSGNTYTMETDRGLITNKQSGEKIVVSPELLYAKSITIGLPFDFGGGQTSRVIAVKNHSRDGMLREETVAGRDYDLKNYNYIKFITDSGDEIEYARTPDGYEARNPKTGVNKFLTEAQITDPFIVGKTTVSIGGKISVVQSVQRIAGDWRGNGENENKDKSS
jgi:hypothetical protein